MVVVKLEKLEGYRTLWVSKGDAYPLATKQDLNKFSHRVPAKPVTAECVALDPASSPSDGIKA